MGTRESLNGRKNIYGTKKSKERREEPLGTMSYQTSSKRSPPFWLLIGARKTQVFWHQSEARTTATVWNWSGKTLGAIHSTKISGHFGPKLNGSVRSNRKSFEKMGPPFEVDHFSRSDRLEFWLNGSRPLSPGALLAVLYFSSFHIYFSARLDFPSPQLSAPGSPRMDGRKPF